MEELLRLPADQIDRAALDRFLAGRHREGINLEYKGALDIKGERPRQRLIDSIAAMANTYGGLILVGVATDEADAELPRLPCVGVAPDAEARLIDRCWATLRPPFAPDVGRVQLDNGNTVLVVRVDPSRVDRPVLVGDNDGRVYVRIGRRNAPADRYRMEALFKEQRTVLSPALLSARWRPREQHPPTQVAADTPATLIVRAGIGAVLPPLRERTVLLDTKVRQGLIARLRKAPLERWLTEQMEAAWGQLSAVREWRAEFHNTSKVATLRWRALAPDGSAPISAQCVLVLPMPTPPGALLRLLLDVVLQPASLDEAMRKKDPTFAGYRLSFERLYDLLHAELETVLEIAAAIFPAILDASVWQPVGPGCHLDGAGGQAPPGAVLDFGGRPRAEDGQDLWGADWEAHPGFDLTDRIERDRMVKHWLQEFLLDSGYTDPEGGIEGLSVERLSWLDKSGLT